MILIAEFFKDLNYMLLLKPSVILLSGAQKEALNVSLLIGKWS